MTADDILLRFQRSWTEPGDVTVLAFDGELPGHQPGQFVSLTLPDVEDDPRGPKRTLTVASAPGEQPILLATRVVHDEKGASPFKRALERLAPGAAVGVKPPRGKLVLEADDRASTHVLIAVGIGVSAVRSLASAAVEAPEALQLRILQTPVDGSYPFEDDFEHFAKRHERVVYVRLTRGASVNRVREAVGEPLEKPRYYLAGPPDEVLAMRKLLVDAGADTGRFKVESYGGY